MGETYTKDNLIGELAKAANISKRRAGLLLETLTQIAYREARKGFAVPGICRLDVVHRKARLVRNPMTNQLLQIAEHDALRVRPVKHAKDVIAPTPRAMVHVVAEPEAAPATPAATPPATPAATPAATPKPYTVVPPPATSPKSSTPPPTAAPKTPSATDASEDGQFISFRCKNCGQEIEAPIEMIDAPNECPTCAENLIVPCTSEPGTIWYQARATSPEKFPLSPSAIASMKGRTIRIELPDDL